MASPDRAAPARRFDLVAFDLDGTLIRHHEPIWKTFHERMGSCPRWRRAVLHAAVGGQLTYDEWFDSDLQMLHDAGATRADLEAIAAELEPTAGAEALVRDLRAAGCRVAVLSGGVDLVRRVVLPEVVFDHVHINRIDFDGEGRIEGGLATRFDREHKVVGLRDLAARWGTTLERTAFVGDGPNDVAAAAAAGLSIAWGDGCPELVVAADVVVCAATLDALRPLLL